MSTASGDPAEIRQQIEATREQLGDTVEALAAKTDVTGQAKRKLHETKEHVSAKAEDIAGRLRHATPDSAGSASGQAVHGVKQAAQSAWQKPAVAACAAFSIGFLIGRHS